MNTPRPLLFLTIFAATSRFALAHPGHDGGHELTWDLEHLAAHPFATIGTLAVVALAAWGFWRITRRTADRT